MRASTKQSGPPFHGFALTRWGGISFAILVIVLDIWAISANSVNKFVAWGTRGFQLIVGIPLIVIGHVIINPPLPHPREIEPDIPLATAEAILKALEKAPDDRFGSAGEFAKALYGE